MIKTDEDCEMATNGRVSVVLAAEGSRVSMQSITLLLLKHRAKPEDSLSGTAGVSQAEDVLG